MSTVSNEQFLLAIIETMDGKINFKEVAEKLGLKESAARMRWTRYKAKLSAAAGNNTNTSTADGNEDDDGGVGVGTPKKTPKKTATKKSTPKKRKIGEDGDDEETKVKTEEE